MRIIDRSVYVGPSLYARFPVIRLELDLGKLEAWPTGRLGPAFIDALAAALPGLAEHGCSYREPGGFYRRMREGEGTWLGHVLEHVAIELQNIAGEEVTFGKTRSAGTPGVPRSSMSTRSAMRASPPANWACACCCRCCRRSCVQTTPCHPGGAGRRRAMSSSASRSGAPWVLRHTHWCAPPKRAAFRGCA